MLSHNKGNDGSETLAAQATALARAIVAARPALFWRCDRRGRPAPQPLSAGSVALLVKELVAGAGLDPAAYSGHSPRAGLVTAADAAGASPLDIAIQSRHASLDTVRRYIRRSSAWRRNVTKGLLDQAD